MKLIPTTATAIEKIKARAKSIRKERKIAHQAALEEAAGEDGYESWFHVMWCARHGQLSVTATQGKSSERKRFIAEAQRYMDYLAAQGCDAVLTKLPVKGNIFHAIELDGQYFYGAVSIDGPVVVRRSAPQHGLEMGFVQLGGAEIHFTSERRTQAEEVPQSWFACKYGPQEPRIPLGDLSPVARHALAYEFGIPIRAMGSFKHPPAGPWFLFYLSPAFQGLCDLARRHPRKARGWGSSAYLSCWGEAARAGKYVWDDQEEAESGRRLAALLGMNVVTP